MGARDAPFPASHFLLSASFLKFRFHQLFAPPLHIRSSSCSVTGRCHLRLWISCCCCALLSCCRLLCASTGSCWLGSCPPPALVLPLPLEGDLTLGGKWGEEFWVVHLIRALGVSGSTTKGSNAFLAGFLLCLYRLGNLYSTSHPWEQGMNKMLDQSALSGAVRAPEKMPPFPVLQDGDR